LAALVPSHLTGPVEVPLVALLPGKDYVSITLSEDSNVLEDLQDFEDTEEAAINEEIVKEASRVNEVYAEYMAATSKVPINKDNLEDHMLTILNYQSQDPVHATGASQVNQ
jgi:hypothetical protein